MQQIIFSLAMWMHQYVDKETAYVGTLVADVEFVHHQIYQTTHPKAKKISTDYQ